jgi:hypothetical protein
VIKAKQVEGDETFVIEIEGARVAALMDVFDSDYGMMA